MSGFAATTKILLSLPLNILGDSNGYTVVVSVGPPTGFCQELSSLAP